MVSWRDDDLAKFLGSFDSYWPGRLRLQDPRDAMVLTWRDVAQAFDVQVALQSLKELFENQERAVAPTPAAFRGVAIPLQRYVKERARLQKLDHAQGGTSVPVEDLVPDDSFWEPLLDNAPNQGAYDSLQRIRTKMAQGAIRTPGDVLDATIATKCAPERTSAQEDPSQDPDDPRNW